MYIIRIEHDTTGKGRGRERERENEHPEKRRL
jgi:hypothetical protein